MALYLTRSRTILIVALVLLGAILLALPFIVRDLREQGFEGKAKVRDSGRVSAAVVNVSSFAPALVPAAIAPSNYTPQTRLGFPVDNEWEPAIAIDRFNHVYVLYPQYGGVPGCSACYSPTMILQISSDGGKSWASPSIIFPAGASLGQWDAQIVVDPVDGQTVFAAFLQNGKSEIVVGKSTDFGATWSFVTANSSNAGQDKDILAVRGQDVYVVYNHAQTVWASYSHDGGEKFTSVKVNQNGKLGWSLAGGGTVTPDGSVFFSWNGYEGNGGAKGNVNLYISKSIDGGATWSTKLLDISSSPPDCSAFGCGWAFLGAAMTMTSDSAGNLYALWNAGISPKGPERIYFSKSVDRGNTWTPKQDVSLAPTGSQHAFPAIAAGNSRVVRIAWMDARAANGGMDRWNVYVRSSSDGGVNWSSETDVSNYVSGFSYIFDNGFRFPFGDYFEMEIDGAGLTHLVWGEGYSYDSPGSIWYCQGK